MELKCPLCKNEWNYKGSKMYATCTNCYSKVRVEKNIINEDA